MKPSHEEEVINNMGLNGRNAYISGLKAVTSLGWNYMVEGRHTLIIFPDIISFLKHIFFIYSVPLSPVLNVLCFHLQCSSRAS